MNKKAFYSIVIILIIILGGFFYYNYNKSQENKKNSDKIFVLVENEDDILLSEDLNLMPELEKQYKEKLQEAQNNLKQAGEITDENKEAIQSYYNNIALYNSYLGNYKEAYDNYLISLKLYPDDRIVWLALGNLLMKMQAFESAEKAINEGLRWNPYDNFGWTKKIALYEAWLGNTPESAQKIDAIYKEAIQKTNNDQLLVNNYADWLAKIGRKEEAIQMYKKLIEIAPENEEAINRKINNLNK